MHRNVGANDLKIMGLNLGHDGGCALLVGEQIQFAISEERVSRFRYAAGWLNSMMYCLKAAELTIEDIDLFVFSNYGTSLKPGYDGDLGRLRSYPAKVISADHHLSHAIGAFALSSFDEALIIVMDGLGNNNETESYYVANRQSIKRIGANSSSRPRAKGIGATYEAFTNYLGFSDHEAGKTMGLAAYGDPTFLGVELFDVVGDQVASKLEQTHQYGVNSFAKKSGIDLGGYFPPHTSENAKNIAAYVQCQTEFAILELVRNLIGSTGLRTICLSGGVALNCLSNTRLRDILKLDSLFVLPFASDTGQAVGNALYGYYWLTGRIPKHPLDTCFFGRPYSESEILSALEREAGTVRYNKLLRYKYSYARESQIAKTAAQLLSNGSILGWFQGRSELGPRALGHRSILADPRSGAMRERLNNRVKHREWFRPFAPSILREAVPTFFTGSTISPFMLEAPTVKHDVVPSIQATVHVDGTARPQIVDKSQDPLLHELIKAFEKLTGVPAVLNTSFNDREPIVETPGDALSTFLSTDLDYLVLEDYMVFKPTE